MEEDIGQLSAGSETPTARPEMLRHAAMQRAQYSFSKYVQKEPMLLGF
jgi:hypothetical protein